MQTGSPRLDTAGNRRGRGTLALSDDTKNKRGAKGEKRSPGGPASDRDVGHALRSIYSSTVNEEIPTDLIDLLGKLS